MYPVISYRCTRICRPAVCIVITFYGQIAVVVQETDIVLRFVQLGISVRSREECPVCSCPLIFNVVGNSHLLHAGQKASAGNVCNVQPLRGSAVQVKGVAASFIAARQRITSDSLRSFGNNILSCSQIFKIKIEKKFRLDIRGVLYFNIKFRCLFTVSNCNCLCSFCRKVHVTEGEVSRVFGSAVVSDIFRSSVLISYRQDKACWKQFLRINFVFCLDRSRLHFDFFRSVGFHYPVVLFCRQRDNCSVTFAVRIKVKVIIVRFDPFCVFNICGIERHISHAAVIVRQQSVGRYFLSVHFLPVILIVGKKFRAFQIRRIAGDIFDEALCLPYALVRQPLAAVITFFHTDRTACGRTTVIISFCVS